MLLMFEYSIPRPLIFVLLAQNTGRAEERTLVGFDILSFTLSRLKYSRMIVDMEGFIFQSKSEKKYQT